MLINFSWIHSSFSVIFLKKEHEVYALIIPLSCSDYLFLLQSRMALKCLAAVLPQDLLFVGCLVWLLHRVSSVFYEDVPSLMFLYHSPALVYSCPFPRFLAVISFICAAHWKIHWASFDQNQGLWELSSSTPFLHFWLSSSNLKCMFTVDSAMYEMCFLHLHIKWV